MEFKCPGAKEISQPKPETVKCPFCSGEVEIWSDEIKAKCPKCGKTVTREQGQCCLDWCEYARQCVGDEAYENYMRNKGASARQPPENRK